MHSYMYLCMQYYTYGYVTIHSKVKLIEKQPCWLNNPSSIESCSSMQFQSQGFQIQPSLIPIFESYLNETQVCTVVLTFKVVCFFVFFVPQNSLKSVKTTSKTYAGSLTRKLDIIRCLTDYKQCGCVSVCFVCLCGVLLCHSRLNSVSDFYSVSDPSINLSELFEYLNDSEIPRE